MSLKKYIIILLSLLLCFSTISAQANVSYALDYDILSLDEGSKIKVNNDIDPNEPAILPLTHSLETFITAIEFVLHDEIYRQPNSLPLLRPPIV